MIIDNKYHIASLVAVFLSLGIGIIIGSVIVGESFTENIIAEQEKLVRQLEYDYSQLKTEAKVAKEEAHGLEMLLGQYKKSVKEMLPYLFSGKLSGKRITVLEGSNTLPGFLVESLRQTGANVVFSKVYRNLLSLSEKSSVSEADLRTFWEEMRDTDITIICRPSANRAIEKLLADNGVRLYFVDTENSGAVNENQRADGVYYIGSEDSLTEQVSLLFALVSGLAADELKHVLSPKEDSFLLESKPQRNDIIDK